MKPPVNHNMIPGNCGTTLANEFESILGLSAKFGGLVCAGFEGTLWAPLTSTLSLLYGTGTYTFSRTSNATVTDFDGLVHDVNEQEARFQGARRVENLLSSPEITVALGTAGSGITDPENGTTAFSVTENGVPANNGLALDTVAVPLGTKIVSSVWIRSDDITSIRLYTSVTGSSSETITISNEWARYSVGAYATTTANATMGLFATATEGFGTGDSFEYWHPQLEIVDGQTVGETGVPSEYVSVGVGTGSEEILAAALADYTDAYWDTVSAGWATGTTGFTGTSATSWVGRNQAVGATSPFVPGQLYAIQWEIVSISGGSLQVYAGLSSASSAQSTTGIYTDVLRYDDGGVLGGIYIDGVTAFTGEARILSIKLLDHGSNVDGVKYFSTANENTVDGFNVVIDNNPGAAIADATLDGVLIEGARTNKFWYSEDPGSGTGNAFIGSACGFGATVGPDIYGRDTLREVDEATTTAPHYVQDVMSITANTYNAFSVALKKNGNRYVSLGIYNAVFTIGIHGVFDFDTGTWQTIPFGFGGATLGTYGITDKGGGLFDVYITGNLGGVITSASIAVVGTDDASPATLDSYLGVSGNGFTVGNVQFEEGIFPSSRIPTAGGAATRTAESLTYDAANYSDEMTVLFEFTLPRDGDVSPLAQTMIEFESNSIVDLSVFVTGSGLPNITEVTSAANLLTMTDSGLISAETKYTVILTRNPALNSSLAYIDGVEFSLYSLRQAMSGATCSDIYIGRDAAGSEFSFGAISKVQIWDSILPASKLISLSS